MTMAEIRQLCVTACSKYNIEFRLDIEVNPRLTRTLGRVTQTCAGGKWRPTKFELSQRLLDNGSNTAIRDVVLHECAHYIAVEVTRENHGHDAYFRSICHTLGTDNDQTQYRAWSLNDTIAKDKYTIRCTTCNEDRGGYARMCPTLKRLDECYCKKCGKFTLTYTQNW